MGEPVTALGFSHQSDIGKKLDTKGQLGQK